MTARPPEPALRDLPRYQHSLRIWRMFVPVVAAVSVPVACCSGPDGRDPVGLVIPAGILVFGSIGSALLVVSLSVATRAIDVATWTIAPTRLGSARQLSLIAAAFLGAGVLTPLGGLLLLSTLAPAHFFGPLASLVLAAPTLLALLQARSYRKLIEWHRTAPPEALRPPLYAWPGPYQHHPPS